MKGSHIALTLEGKTDYQGYVSSRKSRSIRRHWNSLSKFQKNLILLTCITLGIIIFVVQNNYVNNISSHKATKKDDVDSFDQKAFIKPEVQNNVLDEDYNNQLQQNDFINDTALKIPNNPLLHNRDHQLSKLHFKGPRTPRQTAIFDAFMHAWTGYKQFAWGHDNLKPISQTHSDWFGLGLTIIDALDGLYIMNAVDEFNNAKEWVKNELKLDVNKDVNLFEVTIRVLGGLLSAYHLSGEIVFLQKATELGQRLLPCFDSPSGIPYSDINLFTMKAHSPKWSPDSSTSEVTTLQMEFRDLSYSTSESIFREVVDIINDKVHALDKNNGLVPIFINANTGKFREYSTVSLGARGDSHYEYLLKQWLQSGKRSEDERLINDYKTAVDGIIKMLVRKTPKEGHLYVGELINGKDFKPKMDHLVCFLPGTLILGYKHGMPDTHLELARGLLDTCYQTYKIHPTNLAPEITHFNINGENEHDLYVKTNDAHNLLRPEFVESLYYFYVITNDTKYQDMGWDIFQSFEKHTKVKSGYTSIGNVKHILNTKPRDSMESFWLGETLKYFYLLFSDDTKEIDLDKWVFNTEAHPLPIRKLL